MNPASAGCLSQSASAWFEYYNYQHNKELHQLEVIVVQNRNSTLFWSSLYFRIDKLEGHTVFDWEQKEINKSHFKLTLNSLAISPP